MADIIQLVAAFEQLRDLPRDERDIRLEEIRSADAELAHEVQRRLDFYDLDGKSRDAPTRSFQGSSEDTPRPRKSESGQRFESGQTLASYEVLGVLGQGGMGVVYKARDPELNRLVALKQIARGSLATERELRRFKIEAEAAANLSHPGIVSVYEIGEHEGQPYIAMEYVDGVSLTEFLRENSLSANQAAGLLEKIADALAHAHESGVVHRDIKPGNILIDEKGEPHITDFGLAKRLEAESGYTLTNEMLGTPHYMSPEQAEGRSGEIGPRSDVFALGVLLYQLLTNRRPFEGENLGATIKLITAKTPAAPRELNHQVPRELNTICMKCLEKDSRDRLYNTARELADDLRRFADKKPILAQPTRVSTKFRKAIQRHPFVATLGTMAITLFLIAVTATVSGFRQSHLRSEIEVLLTREEAAKEAEKDQRIKAEGLVKEKQALLAKNEALTGELEESLRVQEYAKSLSELKRAHEEKRLEESPSLPEVPWEAKRLLYEMKLARPFPVARMRDHTHAILDAELNPATNRLITSAADGRIILWDLERHRKVRTVADEGRWLPESRRKTGDDIPTWLHHLQDRLAEESWPLKGLCCVDLCWLNDSEFAGASLDGRGLLYDVRQKEPKLILKTKRALTSVQSNTDGSRILFGSEAGDLFLYDPSTPDALASAKLDTAIVTIGWWSSGKRWVVGCENGRLLVLDQEKLNTVGSTNVPAPLWSLDLVSREKSGLCVVGCQSQNIYPFVLENKDKKTIATPEKTIAIPAGIKPVSAVHFVRFVRQGRTLYAVDDLGRLSKFDASSNRTLWCISYVGANPVTRQLQDLSAARSWPLPLAMQRQGMVIGQVDDTNDVVTASRTATVCRWREELNDGRLKFKTGAEPRIAFDSKRPEFLWVLTQNGLLQVFNARGERTDEVIAHAQGGNDLALMSASEGVVTVGKAGNLKSWNLTEDGKIATGAISMAHDAALLSVCCSHNGNWIASVDSQARLVVWQVSNKSPIFTTSLSGGDSVGEPLTGELAFDPADRYLAAFGAGIDCGIFSTQESPFRRLDKQVELAGDGGTALAWDENDPGFVVFSDQYGRYDAREFETWKKDLRGLERPQSPCVAIAKSVKGRRWLLLEQSGRVVVFDPEYLGEVWQFQSDGAAACDIAIDCKDSCVAVAHRDGSVEIWMTEPAGQPIPNGVAHTTGRTWKGEWLLHPSTNRVYTSSQSAIIDNQDRVAIAAQRQSGDTHELFFLREGYEEELVEPEGLGGTPILVSMCQEMQAQPTIAYRYRSTESPKERYASVYAGDLRLARRVRPSHWQKEVAVENTNTGFLPIAVARGGRVEEVFCYHYGLMCWRRSFRVKNTWETHSVGRRADGWNPRWACDSSGSPHFVFSLNSPLGNGVAPPLYAYWDGTRMRREVVDPAAILLDNISLRPDGTPLVLTGRSKDATRQPDWFLATRNSEEDWDYEDVPFDQLVRGSLACATDGRVFLVGLVQDDHLAVFETFDGKWSWSLLENSLTSSATAPGWSVVRFDSKGLPVVVVGGSPARDDQAGGWVRIYRLEQESSNRVAK